MNVSSLTLNSILEFIPQQILLLSILLASISLCIDLFVLETTHPSEHHYPSLQRQLFVYSKIVS